MPTPSTSTSPRCTARLWPPDTPISRPSGISAAGNVSADRKTLTFSANIPAWINYDLSEHVGALIDHAVPVVVENDANCAGWGEYVHGAGQGSSNMSP